MKRNERTLQMMRNYISLHAEGMTPRDIAKKYHISNWVVYNALQEIAEKAGVTRESLLAQPHAEPKSYDRVSKPVKPIDVEVLEKKLQNAIKLIGEFKDMVQTAIDDVEDRQKRGLNNGD